MLITSFIQELLQCNHIYDFAPVNDGQVLKYKIIIMRERASLNELEQELYDTRSDNSLLKKIIDSSYDGIYITDGEGRTLYFNDAFARISGFNREECIGVKAEELVAKGWATKACSSEVIKQRKSVSMTIKYVNGNEGMLSGSPVFDENGNLIRTLLNVRDMTELNRLNEELKKATALTASYRQQLKEVQLEYQRAHNIIFKSKAMQNIIDLSIKVANSDVPVLILGESGSGKDVIANFIHSVSERSKKGNFVQINCGSIPETLLESELFGYEKGAFTGAVDKGKIGLFELAHGGTFFLDEIGDMPLALQVKMLDVIQSKRIIRLGGTRHIPVDVRIIAATNKNLEQMVKERKFRLDLFYRLNVVTIQIPALRERNEDIIPLVEHFLQEFNLKYKTEKYLSPQALERILYYAWPGNVRELQNVLQRVVVTSEGSEIKVADLPVNFREPALDELVENDNYSGGWLEGFSHKDFMERVEKKFIQKALSQHPNLRKTADALGIDISTLVRKKQKYGI